MECYSVQNLTFTYPQKNNPALTDLSFSIRTGQFVVLCGASGSGKTTLLRQLKPSCAPHGEKTGEIFFEGAEINTLDPREQSRKIGFVMQNPDNQIVTDKVWHELAFGLESLGLDTPSIRRRVAEMASFFGIQTWLHKNVAELSGGQKQLLNLASIMAMQPSALILDEPTSQLDPIAAAEFLDMVAKINRELGVTVILTEHRLEEVFHHADRVLVMEEGRLIFDGAPAEIGMKLRDAEHGMFAAMPVPMRVYASTYSAEPCPVSVREGRDWLSSVDVKRDLPKGQINRLDNKKTPAIEYRGVHFKYGKELPDVVKGLSFAAYSGEICAVLGGNGTGKTTAISLAAGVNTPYRGTVRLFGEEVASIPSAKLFRNFLGVLPQNPQSLFVKKTVEEDLYEMLSDAKIPKTEKDLQVQAVARLCELERLMKSHPYDLSGGEQQRAALAKVLLLRPRILLLDEPTKGLDAEFKQTFAEILHDLTAEGVCVVMVSHDVEFCAEHADRCALFFDGDIVSEGISREFFSGNSFYTTAANRMARHILPEVVIAADIIRAIDGREPTPPKKKSGGAGSVYEHRDMVKDEKTKLSRSRMCVAVISGVILLCAVIAAAIFGREFTDFISGGSAAEAVAIDPLRAWSYVGIIAAVLGAATVLTLSLNPREDDVIRVAKGQRRLNKRTVAASLMVLLVIPLTIYVGMRWFGDRKYYFVSLLIILETMLPFAMVFESRKPQARELVVIAALTAIAVAGRAAFFMLPQFKPVAALVIISGVAFGGEAGFLVGALTGFVSNMFFGQSPLTPWQMFAFGIIGFIAGTAFRKGLLTRSREALCVFGFLSSLLIYGGIMNAAVVLTSQAELTKGMFYAAYIQGIPFDLVHGAATVTFLLVAEKPMLEKLDRIKTKYGLTE